MTRTITFIDSAPLTGDSDDRSYVLVITADAFGDHIASINALPGIDPLSVFRAGSQAEALEKAQRVLQSRHPGMHATISAN